MPQVRKEEVEQRIRRAALEVFARRGYRVATVADIAAEAGVSTGNVYRYFESKEALFCAVIDDNFVRHFQRMLRDRVAALRRSTDAGDMRDGPPAFSRAVEASLRFSIVHRLELVVLLARADGSPWEHVAEQTVTLLIDLAIAHAKSVRPDRPVTNTMRFVLEQIYRSFQSTLVAVLEHYENESDIRAAIAQHARYHLTGLQAFFELV